MGTVFCLFLFCFLFRKTILASPEAPYDGYLFQVTDDLSMTLFSDMIDDAVENVYGDLYWTAEEGSLDVLEQMGMILYSEPNYLVTLFDETADQEEPADPEIPTDPGSYGWPYDTLEAGYAGSHGLNGNGVRIALIDSGIDTANGNLQDAHILNGYDYIDDTSAMSDPLYHGTKAAQVLAGSPGAPGTVGIAPGVEIVPLRCFSSRSGSVRTIVRAIRDAIDVYGCDILNMSWGLAPSSKTLYDAIQYASNAGVLMIAAAGNVTSSYPQGTLIYPACYDEVISVSAIDTDLQILSSSQVNDSVLLCAPGGHIPFLLESGNVSYDSGTSFSAPCISAEVAILLQLAPYLDTSTIVSLLTTRAMDLGEAGYDIQYGYGLVTLDQLIGRKWIRVSGTSTDDASQPWICGWYVQEEEEQVLLASYDGDGSALTANFLSREEDVLSFNQSVPEGARQLVFFYLYPNGTPYASSDRFTIGNGSSDEMRAGSDNAGVYDLKTMDATASLIPQLADRTEITAGTVVIGQEILSDYYLGARRFEMTMSLSGEREELLVAVLKGENENLTDDTIVYIDQLTDVQGTIRFNLYPSALEDGSTYCIYTGSKEERDAGLKQVAAFRYHGTDSSAITSITAVPASLSIVVGNSGVIFITDDLGNAINAKWSVQEQWGSRAVYGEPVVTVSGNGAVRAESVGSAMIRAEYHGLTAQSIVSTLFADVSDPTRYFFEPVYWAAANGITTGTGPSLFSWDDACTREQIVTFLWRMLGSPEPSYNQGYSFIDVPMGLWYSKAVLWAAEHGITKGLNDGTGRFGVGLPCTREMCVTFLWRAAGQQEPEGTSDFTDLVPGAYYVAPVTWAIENHITTGLNDGTGRFGVGQDCIRGMIVTFLYRFHNNVGIIDLPELTQAETSGDSEGETDAEPETTAPEEERAVEPETMVPEEERAVEPETTTPEEETALEPPEEMTIETQEGMETYTEIEQEPSEETGGEEEPASESLTDSMEGHTGEDITRQTEEEMQDDLTETESTTESDKVQEETETSGGETNA